MLIGSNRKFSKTPAGPCLPRVQRPGSQGHSRSARAATQGRAGKATSSLKPKAGPHALQGRSHESSEKTGKRGIPAHGPQAGHSVPPEAQTGHPVV